MPIEKTVGTVNDHMFTLTTTNVGQVHSFGVLWPTFVLSFPSILVLSFSFFFVLLIILLSSSSSFSVLFLPPLPTSLLFIFPQSPGRIVRRVSRLLLSEILSNSTFYLAVIYPQHKTIIITLIVVKLITLKLP